MANLSESLITKSIATRHTGKHEVSEEVFTITRKKYYEHIVKYVGDIVKQLNKMTPGHYIHVSQLEYKVPGKYVFECSVNSKALLEIEFKPNIVMSVMNGKNNAVGFYIDNPFSGWVTEFTTLLKKIFDEYFSGAVSFNDFDVNYLRDIDKKVELWTDYTICETTDDENTRVVNYNTVQAIGITVVRADDGRYYTACNTVKNGTTYAVMMYYDSLVEGLFINKYLFDCVLKLPVETLNALFSKNSNIRIVKGKDGVIEHQRMVEPGQFKLPENPAVTQLKKDVDNAKALLEERIAELAKLTGVSNVTEPPRGFNTLPDKEAMQRDIDAYINESNSPMSDGPKTSDTLLRDAVKEVLDEVLDSKLDAFKQSIEQLIRPGKLSSTVDIETSRESRNVVKEKAFATQLLNTLNNSDTCKQKKSDNKYEYISIASDAYNDIVRIARLPIHQERTLRIYRNDAFKVIVEVSNGDKCISYEMGSLDKYPNNAFSFYLSACKVFDNQDRLATKYSNFKVK